MSTDYHDIAEAAIAESPEFWEYPSHLLTLQLCQALAIHDKRKVKNSLNACAATLAAKTQEPRLRELLQKMARNPFPVTDIAVLRAAKARIIKQMENAMIVVAREKARLHALYPDRADYEAAVAALAKERRVMARELRQ